MRPCFSILSSLLDTHHRQDKLAPMVRTIKTCESP